MGVEGYIIYNLNVINYLDKIWLTTPVSGTYKTAIPHLNA